MVMADDAEPGCVSRIVSPALKPSSGRCPLESTDPCINDSCTPMSSPAICTPAPAEASPLPAKKRPPAQQIDPEVAIRPYVRQHVSEMRRLFRQLDKQGNGMVGIVEFRRVLEHGAKAYLSDTAFG